jgi:hypothetical protein
MAVTRTEEKTYLSVEGDVTGKVVAPVVGQAIASLLELTIGGTRVTITDLQQLRYVRRVCADMIEIVDPGAQA